MNYIYPVHNQPADNHLTPKILISLEYALAATIFKLDIKFTAKIINPEKSIIGFPEEAVFQVEPQG